VVRSGRRVAVTPTPPFELSIKTDLRPDPRSREYARHYAEVLEEVRLADQLGYRSVWTTEHHGQDDGYLAAQFPALAAFATVTSRLRVGTGVLILAYYKLRQVLENVAFLDALSAGRLELGVGVGQYEREFAFFDVDIRRRGQLLEDGVRELRQAFVDGGLKDGAGGELIPITPPPVRGHIPVLIGGWAPAAVDRAARLGDGYIGADSGHPEVSVPDFFQNALGPALERHGRSLDTFRYVLGLPVWVTDDAERDWNGHFGTALRYQQRRYAQAAGDDPAALEFDLGRALVGRAPELAERLLTMWKQAPWHELVFYPRLPGVPHGQAMEQIDRVSSELRPALSAAAARLVRCG
jgi:alkanesulfonate monooxygenase SsuD/methylene tetrahydromethanopterin reductase-like flavin-dependent oxidoreductase (luciferase family)